MKDRIRLLMEQTKLSQQDFAMKLGISPASLSGIFTGRTNPTNNHVNAIHRAFPEVNVSWLLFGEGEMYEATGAGGQHPGGQVAAEAGSLFPPSEVLSPEAQAAMRASGVPVSTESAAEPPVPAHAMRSLLAQFSQTAKKEDKPRPKIKEIRVFYDDGTYESFPAPAR